ncbi:MAG: endonuclease III, partial [Bacteroidales bacterium]|nr:endonuclease III [Bacteroidales bacterium]
RYVCLARKPHCDMCGLTDVCQFCQRQRRAKLS